MNSRKYRNPTDIFDVNYADNGIFGIVEGGPTKVAADGYLRYYRATPERKLYGSL